MHFHEVQFVNTDLFVILIYRLYIKQPVLLILIGLIGGKYVSVLFRITVSEIIEEILMQHFLNNFLLLLIIYSNVCKVKVVFYF